MKSKALLGLLAGTLAMAGSVFAGSNSAKEAGPAPVIKAADADSMRIEGEKRFHENCSRCHAAPQKFPPRMMGTVLRHMRVRATITEQDRRLILFYMTQ